MTVALSGADIYRNFQDSSGVDGLAGGAAIVNEVAGEYDEDADAIRRLIDKMDSVWQGDAAGAAQRGAGPLASEHELSGPALHKAQELTTYQTDAFGSAKNSVMPVPPKPTAPDPWVAFSSPGEWSSFEDQVDDYNAASKHNVATMWNYTGTSLNNAATLPQEYGTLTDDQSGVTVDPGTTIDSDSFDKSDGDSGSRSDAPRDTEPGEDTGWNPGGTDSDAPAPGGQPDTLPGLDGTTTPGGYSPSPSPAGTPIPGVDAGSGAGRPPTGVTPGVGLVAGPGLVGGESDAGGRGPRGGGTGGPRGGALGAVPRDGVLRGPGVGAEPPGATRSAASGSAGAGGRGGAGMGGVPLGAAGGQRGGRGEEDTERKRPEYLEGEDPEELYGSDVLTAPPAIGDEDDE